MPLLDMMSSGTLGQELPWLGELGTWREGTGGEGREGEERGSPHVVVMISSLVLRISSTGPWNLQDREQEESSESQATTEVGATDFRRVQAQTGPGQAPCRARLHPSLPDE